MSVGVPVLDADHRTLMGLINDLHRSIGDAEEYATLGSVLSALAEYAEHHFAREERMMLACRYPAASAHIQMHRALAGKVQDLKAAYERDRTAVRARDCLAFLNSWLIEHICSTDMDYRGWLVGHAEALDEAQSMTIAGPRQGAASLDWRALRVLAVDDNLNFCQVLRTILEGVGVVNIRVANDIDTAKTVLVGTQVDVVITDWHVGEGSGIELVSWLRRNALLADLPVLMLSGHERIANRDVALNAGADEFMEKPISARGLLIALARLMQKERGE